MIKRHPDWDIPMANRHNVLEVFDELGIRPWKELRPAVDLTAYLAGALKQNDRDDATRFAPKNQAVFLEKPNGEPYTGFRSIGKDWATVFALLPGYLVPVVGEFKHGTMCLSLCNPSGMLGKNDGGLLENAGKREFEEEVGMTLKNIVRLGSPSGIGASTRQSTQKCHPFLGMVDMTVPFKPSKLDVSEILKLVLIPVHEWLAILDEKCEDASAILTTHLALRKLNWF